MMSDFISFKKWLVVNEQANEDKTYGCIMLEANVDDWKEIHLAGIDENDVIFDDEDDLGYEDTPHMTLLYGIHEDDIDPSVIREALRDNVKSFTASIDGISYFHNDEYDVVKYDINPSKEMLNYRRMFMKNFENTQTYDEFHPHMTIAYCKPGTGKKYTKKLNEPLYVTFVRGVYSYHVMEDGEKTSKRSVIRLKRRTDGNEPDLSHP